MTSRTGWALKATARVSTSRGTVPPGEERGHRNGLAEDEMGAPPGRLGTARHLPLERGDGIAAQEKPHDACVAAEGIVPRIVEDETRQRLEDERALKAGQANDPGVERGTV